MYIPPILQIYAQQKKLSAAHPSLQFADFNSVKKQIDVDRIASLFFYRVKELTIAAN